MVPYQNQTVIRSIGNSNLFFSLFWLVFIHCSLFCNYKQFLQFEIEPTRKIQILNFRHNFECYPWYWHQPFCSAKCYSGCIIHISWWDVFSGLHRCYSDSLYFWWFMVSYSIYVDCPRSQSQPSFNGRLDWNWLVKFRYSEMVIKIGPIFLFLFDIT